jgi:hypothetical protein
VKDETNVEKGRGELTKNVGPFTEVAQTKQVISPSQ